MRLLFILLLAIIGILFPACANELSCSNSRKFECRWREADVPENFDTSNLKKSTSSAIKLQELNVFYLIKVNATTGKLYVSANLRWKFSEKAEEEKIFSGFYVFIRSEDFETTIFYEVELRRKVFTSELREISIPLENKLQLGKKYVFFITTNPKNLNATTYKSLSIPSMPQETSTCSPKEIVSTRKIASQWSTAFPSIKLFPLHGFINVSFFGAPQNLCIYRYMVQLWLDGVLLVEEIIVSQVTPFEYSEFDHLCVCQYDETRETCDCVAVQSKPFVFSLDESHFQHPQKTFPNEIQLEITTTKEKSPTETRFYIVLATILGFLTLIFILLLVRTISKRTCPSNKFKKNYVLVNQMNKGGQGPLIRQSKYKSILILDVDPFGKAMSELLAQQLEAEGIKVRFAPWEKSIIEENKFQWILQVQHEVNKILLFHSHHARQVIEDQGAGRVMLEDIFYNLISMLGFNDNRIIHTCWENSKDLLLPSTETMYVLPRDISFLFNALDIAPNEIFFAQFKKMMYKQEVSPTQSIASTDLSSEATQEVTSLVESTEDEETCPLVNGTKIVVDETEKEKAQFSKKPVNENIHDSGFQENDSHLISIAW